MVDPVTTGGVVVAVGAAAKLSEALTRLWIEPRAVRRVAQAEADAKVILAAGEADAADLLTARAGRRATATAIREQVNIEVITAQAVEHARLLPAPPQGTDIEDDWTVAFFDAA